MDDHRDQKERKAARELLERMSVMQGRGADQRLRGNGRRGERGAREEAFNMMSGGGSEYMVGDRVVSREQAMRLIRTGGEGSEEILRRMYDDSGVGAKEDAGGLGMSFADYASTVESAMNGGTVGDSEQAKALRERIGRIDESSAEERQGALERQQRERDPLAAQTVDAINAVNTTLTNNERAEGTRHSAMLSVLRSISRGDEVADPASGGGGVPPAEGAH